MRVAIYIRVSTLDQAREGYSLAAQERTLRQWCADYGHDVVRLYADEGISAKDIDHRPGMKALLEGAEKKEFDLILFRSLSRFSRSVPDLYSTMRILDKHEVKLKSLTEPFDTTSPFGRFTVGLLGLIAQLEREITGERVRAAMLERAKQGKRTTHDVLGFDLDGSDGLKINPQEAARVRYIFEKFYDYRNLSAVSELCDAKGYRGKRGRNLTAYQIKVILSRPIYAGYYSYNGQIFKGNFDAIIPEEFFWEIQNILNAPQKTGRPRKNPITKLKPFQ